MGAIAASVFVLIVAFAGLIYFKREERKETKTVH